MSDKSEGKLESSIVVSVNGRRLRPVTEREAFKARQYEMDFRFVREVEHLEREGRVPGRGQLEDSIGMEKGGLSSVRAGVRSVGMVQLVTLFEKYRGDMQFILFGVRDKERTNPFISGYGRIDKYEGYWHRYASGARWKVGPRPETQIPDPNDPTKMWAPNYPSDPDNEQWREPSRVPADGSKRGRKPKIKDDE